MVKYPNTCPTSCTDSNTVKWEQFSSGLPAKRPLKPINPPAVRQHAAILLRNVGKAHRGTTRLSAWSPPAQCPKTRSPVHGGVLRDQDANTQSPPSLQPGQASKLTSAMVKAKKGWFLIKARTFTPRDLDPTSATQHHFPMVLPSHSLTQQQGAADDLSSREEAQESSASFCVCNGDFHAISGSF